MKIYGLSLAQVQEAAEASKVVLNEVSLQGSKKPYVNCTIRPSDGCPFRKVNAINGRKINAIDFYGHAAFITSLFKINPSAKVVSGVATFDGVNDFIRQFDTIAESNIGSLYQPVMAYEACTEISSDTFYNEYHETLMSLQQ